MVSMYRIIFNILFVVCVALPCLAKDEPLRIDSTFYYDGVPKEDLAEVVEAWLHSRRDMATAFTTIDKMEDRIVFCGPKDSFSDYVQINNIFLFGASNSLCYSFQIAVRDGVVRVWFTDFLFKRAVSDPEFMLYVKRPKKIRFIDRPIYNRVYRFALKRYPERIASLHAALDEALKKPEPLWPIFCRKFIS